MYNDTWNPIEILRVIYFAFYKAIEDYRWLIDLEMIYCSIQSKLHNDDLKKRKKEHRFNGSTKDELRSIDVHVC